MNRMLPLMLLSLLLLAPAARGGELDAGEAAVQEAATRVELLRAELDQAQDAQERSALQERIHEAERLWQARKAELESLRARPAQAADEHAALRQRAEAALEAVRRLQAEVEQGIDEADLAGKQDEADRLRRQSARIREEASRLESARASLEAARSSMDASRYEAARRAFEDARNRLQAVDVLTTGLREAAATGKDLRTHIALMEANLAKMRTAGLPDAHPGLRQRLAQIEQLKAALADLEARRGTPSDATVWLRKARRTQLQERIAEKKAQLAALGTEVPDEHPEKIRLRGEIETANAQLAALEAKATEHARSLTTEEDGRFVILGDEDGRVRLRGRIVVGEEGAEEEQGLDEDEGTVRVLITDGENDEPFAKPVTVRKTVRRTVWRRWPARGPELEEKIDHLRQAATHLREAGQAEDAERLEAQAEVLEAGAGDTRVLEAIGALRQEVHALHQEVKELKALLLKSPGGVR